VNKRQEDMDRVKFSKYLVRLEESEGGIFEEILAENLPELKEFKKSSNSGSLMNFKEEK
jgi:hypothetical protein